MRSTWGWAGVLSGATAGLLGSLLALPATTMSTARAAAPDEDAVVLAYDHSPGTRLVYEFVSEDSGVLELATGSLAYESIIRATVEYEVLPEVTKGRNHVRCRVLSVEVTGGGPRAEGLRTAAAAAAKLPCEGKLGPTGITARLLPDTSDEHATKSAATRLSGFIGVGALGWARLPGATPVKPGDRWGPGLAAKGDGSRIIYTFRGIAHADGRRIATIDFLDEVDRPDSRERAEGRYTFDVDARRWLSTSASSTSERTRTRSRHVIEASLVR